MIAEAQPIIVIIGMPETCRPAMASTTVVPANRTERPAVALARPMASGTGMPGLEVLTVPRQDEQRVVDADTEADHHADDAWRSRARRMAPDSTPMRAHADEQADERDQDRQAHRDERAEGDGQHDDGHQDADLLAAGLGVALGVAESTVVLDLDTGVTRRRGGELLGGLELLDADLLACRRPRS